MNKKYWQDRYNQRMKWMIHYLGNECIRCGSKENLQIDHVNPYEKEYTLSKRHSRNVGVLKEELDKCQLLCNMCHRKKSGKEQSVRMSGVNNPNSKLTEEKVLTLRRLHIEYNLSHRQLGRLFNISHVCAGRVVRKESYQNIGSVTER